MRNWWSKLCPLDKFMVQWGAVGTVYSLIGMSSGTDWMLVVGTGTLFMASMLITFQRAVWNDKDHHKEKEDRDGGVPQPQADRGAPGVV